MFIDWYVSADSESGLTDIAVKQFFEAWDNVWAAFNPTSVSLKYRPDLLGHSFQGNHARSIDRLAEPHGDTAAGGVTGDNYGKSGNMPFPQKAVLY